MEIEVHHVAREYIELIVQDFYGNSMTFTVLNYEQYKEVLYQLEEAIYSLKKEFEEN